MKPAVIRITHEVYVDLDEPRMVEWTKKDMFSALADGVIQPEVVKLKKKEITKKVLKEIEENKQFWGLPMKGKRTHLAREEEPGGG